MFYTQTWIFPAMVFLSLGLYLIVYTMLSRGEVLTASMSNKKETWEITGLLFRIQAFGVALRVIAPTLG